MEDKAIVDLYWQRSDRAIPETECKYGDYCHTIAMRIVNNREDAEECVNDTWLGAWNSIPPNRPDPLRTYVCKIARNLATKRYHANSAQKRDSQYDLALEEFAECVPDESNVEDALAAKDLAEIINRFLDTLSYEDKFVFMRRYWYADSLADIAKMAEMSYNSVAVRLHRVKGKLKKLLLKEGVLL